MKINLEMRSKKILAGFAGLLVVGLALQAIDTTPDAVTEVDSISVDADDGIGDGAEPLPVIEEPVVEEPVVEEPVVEEPVVEEPVIEEPVIEEPVIEEPEEPATEPVEPVATPEPEPVTLTPASLMRTFAPMLMADAGYPMSGAGEHAWSAIEDETFDNVGISLCDVVSSIGFELAALSAYEETESMIQVFGIDPSIGAVGSMFGTFVGAYCPDAL